MAQPLNQHKSTISRELARNTGNPKQDCLLAEERSLGSRNAAQIKTDQWHQTVDRLLEQFSPVQIVAQICISHKTIYRHVYASKAAAVTIWKQLRCQKKPKKCYASGYERRGQIIGRMPISERPAYIETRTQVGHWEGGPVIGAAHKQAVVTLLERKSGNAVIDKVHNKTAKLVRNAIIAVLRPLLKTITFDNGRYPP